MATWIDWVTAVWEESQAKGSDLIVALALAQFADRNGDGFPSIATLRDMSRLGTSGVTGAIRNLERLGELEIREAGSGRKANTYRLLLRERAPGPSSASTPARVAAPLPRGPLTIDEARDRWIARQEWGSDTPEGTTLMDFQELVWNNHQALVAGRLADPYEAQPEDPQISAAIHADLSLPY